MQMLDDKNIVSEIASLPINIFVSYFICLFVISPNKVDILFISFILFFRPATRQQVGGYYMQLDNAIFIPRRLHYSRRRRQTRETDASVIR